MTQLTPDAIADSHSDGACWVLVRQGPQTGAVQRCSMKDLPALLTQDGVDVRLLQYWRGADLEASLGDTQSRRAAQSEAVPGPPENGTAKVGEVKRVQISGRTDDTMAA